jgi:3-dehydroquinate synthase
MNTVTVSLPQNSYDIKIGAGILVQAGPCLKEKGFVTQSAAVKAVIITDTNVNPLYTAVLQQSLADAGFSVNVLEVPAGEGTKTLETAASLYDRLSDVYTERSTVILALGGGVIGDLAGFVAATYKRGIPYIQVPTSLLAMVDSSIGGKTAVDRGKLKNIVGVFYQPRMVIADIGALKTLPPVELSNGMAGVIKTAAIGDAEFFKYLEGNMGRAMALDISVLEKIVRDSAVQKAGVVGRDEKESGERIILNYGHTIGHAIEAVSDFKIKHGQAVSIGIVAANRIAFRRGLLADNEAVRIRNVLEQAGLPVTIPDFSTGEKERVLEVIKHDKKVFNSKVRFVLLKSIGRPVIVDDVAPELVKEVLYGRIA